MTFVVRDAHSTGVIASIGYDARGETLEVEFVAGRVYRYGGVEAEVHTAFMSAPSKGTFFNEQVRGTYPFEQVK